MSLVRIRMRPPISLANQYAAYLRKRYSAIEAKALPALLEGWETGDHMPHQPIRSDAHSHDAIAKLIEIQEEHKIPAVHLENLAHEISKFNKRVIGIPTSGLGSVAKPTNKYWLVEVDYPDPNNPGQTNPYIFRESRSEKAALEAAEKGFRGYPGRVIPPGIRNPQFEGQFAINPQKVISVGVPADSFRDTNLALIKKLDAEQVSELRGILEDAQKNATRVEVLRSQIQERFEVSRSHANLIARDQTLKFNGQLTQFRQQAAGFQKYEWSTSNDERVRPDHADLDGTIQDWNLPPVTDERTGARNHPGGDYQCRCVAIPHLEE